MAGGNRLVMISMTVLSDLYFWILCSSCSPKIMCTNELMQAFRIHIAHGSGAGLMSKASKWLDKGLSRLIGVSELPEGVQGQVQGVGGGGDASKPPPGPHHRRSSSQPDVAKARRSFFSAVYAWKFTLHTGGG